MENFVITFARGFGTGGKAIASQLAKELGIHCYENRILTLASQLSGLDENIFQEVNEKMRETSGFSSFLRGLPRSRRYISRNEKFVSDDKLFEYQSEIIKDLAEKESCVIVGKCADYILKDYDNVVSIYVEAPRSYTLRRIMERMDDITVEEAHHLITKTDKYRADYYKYYTGQEWKNAQNYDLSLDSSRLGFDGTVEAILSYIEVRKKFDKTM